VAPTPTPTGSAPKRHAAGRQRAIARATAAEMPAVTAPRIASEMKWLAVTMITNVMSSGYSAHSTRTVRQRERRASGQAIMSANATCMEGTAA
jgi:hypothetical protein